MTEDGHGTGLPNGGNLWDGDADSEGLRFLLKVASQFATYASEELRWIQADPLAGKDAKTQLALGNELEFVGQAMRRRAELRARSMSNFGGRVLKYLATLMPGERAVPDVIAQVVGVDSTSVELILQDLARSEAVHVWRRRPERIGSPRCPTLYAISDNGRLLLDRPAVVTGPCPMTIESGETADRSGETRLERKQVAQQ